MTVGDVVQALEASGAHFSAAGGRLRVEAPRGLLSEETRRLIVERKPEVLALLTKRSNTEEIIRHGDALDAVLKGRAIELWSDLAGERFLT